MSLLTIHWGEVLVGAGLGFVAALASHFIFDRVAFGRERRILGYRAFSWSIVMQLREVPDVEVTYKGARVQRVTRTRLVMWNPGWEAVESQDVIAEEPVRIVSASGNLLRADRVRQSRPSVSFEPTKCEDGYRCDFALLEHHDGFVVDLLHTGRVADLTVKGAIKKMSGGIRNFGPLSPVSDPVSVLTFGTIEREDLAYLLPVSAVVVFFYALFVWGSLSNPRALGALAALPLVLILLLAFFGLQARRRQPPRSLIANLPDETPQNDSAST